MTVRHRSARIAVLVLLLITAGAAGYAIARADRVDPVVILEETRPRIPTPSGGRLTPPGATVNTGAPCLQPAPSPGLTCQNGEWVAPATEEPRGGGGPWRASGCLTPPPAETFRCQDGVWTMGATPASGAPASGDTSSASRSDAANQPTTSTTTAPSSSTECRGPAPAAPPGSSAACVGGSWIIR